MGEANQVGLNEDKMVNGDDPCPKTTALNPNTCYSAKTKRFSAQLKLETLMSTKHCPEPWTG